METKRIIELLEFIFKSEKGYVKYEDLKKKFLQSEINFCMECELIDRRTPNYFLWDNGISFLNQHYISKNTKKLSEVMNDFKNSSNKYNKKIKRYSGVLILLTVSLVFLTIVLIGLSIHQENQRKNNELNKLLTDLDSLNIELETNQEIIEGIIFCKDKCVNETITMQFPIENLRKNTYNENLRNKYIKKLLVILYFNLEQKNNALLKDDHDYKRKNIENLNMSYKNIKIIRDDLKEFENCIREKWNLNSCPNNYTAEIDYS